MRIGCANLSGSTDGPSPMDTSLVIPPALTGKFTLNDDFPTVQSLLEHLRETAQEAMQEEGLEKGDFEPDDGRQWARVAFRLSDFDVWELGIQFMRNPETNSNVAQAWIRTAKQNDDAPEAAEVRKIRDRLKKALESAFQRQSETQPRPPAGGDRQIAATRPAKSQAKKKARPKPG